MGNFDCCRHAAQWGALNRAFAFERAHSRAYVGDAHAFVFVLGNGKAAAVVAVVDTDHRAGHLECNGDFGSLGVFECVVDQLADHTVENHLYIRVETFGAQIGSEVNLNMGVW